MEQKLISLSLSKSIKRWFLKKNIRFKPKPMFGLNHRLYTVKEVTSKVEDRAKEKLRAA